jgi:hypothetical protein
MEIIGIEPMSRACRGQILPLNYIPLIKEHHLYFLYREEKQGFLLTRIYVSRKDGAGIENLYFEESEGAILFILLVAY